MFTAQQLKAIAAISAFFATGSLAVQNQGSLLLNEQIPTSSPNFHIREAKNGAWNICGSKGCVDTSIICSTWGCFPTTDIVPPWTSTNISLSDTSSQAEQDNSGGSHHQSHSTGAQRVLAADNIDAQCTCPTWQCGQFPGCPSLSATLLLNNAVARSVATDSEDATASVLKVCDPHSEKCCPIWEAGQNGCPQLPVASALRILSEAGVNVTEPASDALKICGSWGCIQTDELMEHLGPLIKKVQPVSGERSELWVQGTGLGHETFGEGHFLALQDVK